MQPPPLPHVIKHKEKRTLCDFSSPSLAASSRDGAFTFLFFHFVHVLPPRRPRAPLAAPFPPACILSRSVSHRGSGLDEDLGENIGFGVCHLNAKPFNLFKQYFCSFPCPRKSEPAPGAVSGPGVTGPGMRCALL